jgi:hypothetical protein
MYDGKLKRKETLKRKQTTHPIDFNRKFQLQNSIGGQRPVEIRKDIKIGTASNNLGAQY